MIKVSNSFLRNEFQCQCGCGFDTVDVELIKIVQGVRDQFGLPVTITSGCRCPSHNASVGGAQSSQHVLGRAADIQVAGVAPQDVQAYLHGRYPDSYGIGSYPTFTHVDSRGSKARWQG